MAKLVEPTKIYLLEKRVAIIKQLAKEGFSDEDISEILFFRKVNRSTVKSIRDGKIKYKRGHKKV